ncbi:MAG: shikimate dehydrogenase [Myxococcota bacterium]
MTQQQPFYRLGLVGYPIDASPSPAMHNAALKQLGLSGHYNLLPCATTKQLPQLLQLVKQQGYCGLNVTVPHKTAVLPHLHQLTPPAQQLQAVNTICIQPDGLLIGHNTDVAGFTNSLQHEGIAIPTRAVLLGAGGAARAVAYALLHRGCQHIDIINRTAQRAQQLQTCLQQLLPQSCIKLWPADKTGWHCMHNADLIINCTSVGAGQHASQSPVPQQHPFSSSQVVYDIIYGTHLTPLLQQAAKCSARVINGNSMLLHQAAASFAIWADTAAPLAAMQQALRTKLN